MGRRKPGAAPARAGKTSSRKGFPALSVRQPWADLLVLGEKDVENRSKPIRYRGWLLIHASKTFSLGDFDYVPDSGIDALRKAGFWTDDGQYNYNGGCIIGMVRVVDCVSDYKSPYFVGPYGWVVKDAINFEKPVDFVGKVGIFYVPLELLKGTPAEQFFHEV